MRPAGAGLPAAALALALLAAGAVVPGVGCGGGGGRSPDGAATVACMLDPGCDRLVAVARRANVLFAAENTVAAGRLSVSQGAHLVEVDVRRSLDGALVLMADETVDRTTTGLGRVENLTLAQLAGIEVLPPDERRQIGDEIAFLALVGLQVIVRESQPIPTFADLVRGLGGRAGIVADLSLPVESVAQAVKQVRALGALPEVLFQVDSVAEARAVLAEDGSAQLLLRPEDATEWEAFERALPADRVRVAHMDPGDPGFAFVQGRIAARGGVLSIATTGTTDLVASSAQASALGDGAGELEALTAARVVYQLAVQATGARAVVTDRVDVVGPFADDFNLGPGLTPAAATRPDPGSE